MRKELEKLTTKQLIELVKTFEHYPAVTLKDGKDYILSYLEDEACTISRKEILEYLLKSGAVVTKDNIHLYYEYMNEKELFPFLSNLDKLFQDRFIKIARILAKELNLKTRDLHCFWSNIKENVECEKSFIFGEKDTLKPLEKYISDIKECNAYKSYIAKVS